LNGIIKIGLGAALVGLVVVASKAQQLLKNFDVKVSGFGVPAIKNYNLSLPIRLRITNPIAFGLSMDRVRADLYLYKLNQWQYVGFADQHVDIPAGSSDLVITPSVDIKSILTGNIIDTALSIMQTKTLNVRADVTAYVLGIALPVQSFSQQVNL
jgi:hypothetical protein